MDELEELFSRLSKVDHFELPPLQSKLPFECHPEFAYVCKETDQWATARMNVVDHDKKNHLVQSRVSLYGPMIHPRGETMKVLLSAKHFWSLFIFDDVVEGAPSHEEAIMLRDMACQIAAGTYAAREVHPSLRMYHEVLTEFRSLASATVLERYLKTFQRYVNGAVEEASLRSSKAVPDVDTYRAIRRNSIGMDSAGGLFMEFCMGLELDSAVVESQVFLHFNEAVIDHICLVNDLLSFRKDYYNKCSHNLLAVTYFHSSAGSEGTTFQQAVDQVCAMIQRKEREILELQTRLLGLGHATGNDHLVRYATCYPLTAAGNLRWSYITGRYHGMDNPMLSGEPFHGTWLLHPQLTVVMPSRMCKEHPYLVV